MKKIDLATLIRPDVFAMESYRPVLSAFDLEDGFIKLDASENPFGTSFKVREALANATVFNYYPDPEYKRLRKAISGYAGVDVKNIMVGAGSDELLDLVLRLILCDGDKVINCPPTFGMYAVLTKLNRGIEVCVPRKKDYSLDIDEILEKLDEKTKAIIICSPNNPTGNAISKKELVALLESGKLVIVDEAYFEFCSKTNVSLLSQYENLIVFRTFSKWAGIAGLRLGYVIASDFLIQQLLKIKQPYNVNLAAEIAAIATLSDVKIAQKNLQKMIDERKRISMALQKIPSLTVYPSEASFVFMKVADDSFSRLKTYLEERKIAVRYYDSELTGKAIRLSIGKQEQNDRVIGAFREFFSPAKLTCDGIIFDMDGVLVDVSKSYRKAIKRTVEYVLEKKFKIKIDVQPEDIESLKSVPGFNNDWDLSFALIELLAKGVKRSDFSYQVSLITDNVRNSKEYQEVKDIFQTYYLGSKLFFKVYKRTAPFVNPKGFIANETLLLNSKLLESLASVYKLGVATSRPRFEALFALKNLGITPYLIKDSYIVAQEDTLREKPAPDPLLEAKKRMNVQNPIYVGDSINDVIAAKCADMPCIFIGESLGEVRFGTINRLREVLL